MGASSFANCYEELAHRHERRNEARQRDICLLLAADAALVAGRIGDAERLRRRLLQLSPHHLLRPYPSLAEAMKSRDIQDFVADLRLQLPPEEAERLLHGVNGKPKPSAASAPPGREEKLATAPTSESAAAWPRETLPIPAPTPRREPAPSPYERFEVPLPPGPGYEALGSWFTTGLYFVVFTIVVGLAAYVFLRPLFSR